MLLHATSSRQMYPIVCCCMLQYVYLLHAACSNIQQDRIEMFVLCVVYDRMCLVLAWYVHSGFAVGVQGLGFRVQGWLFRVWFHVCLVATWFRVQGLGLGFRYIRYGPVVESIGLHDSGCHSMYTCMIVDTTVCIPAARPHVYMLHSLCSLCMYGPMMTHGSVQILQTPETRCTIHSGQELKLIRVLRCRVQGFGQMLDGCKYIAHARSITS